MGFSCTHIRDSIIRQTCNAAYALGPPVATSLVGTHSSSGPLSLLKVVHDLNEVILNNALKAWSADCEFLDPLALAPANTRARISMAHVCYFRPMAIVCTRSNYSKHTVLHVAALHGGKQSVRLVLKAGAVVDATNLQYKTPLHLAVEVGHLEVVKLLLEAGACVDQRAPTTSHRCTLYEDGSTHWHNEL